MRGKKYTVMLLLLTLLLIWTLQWRTVRKHWSLYIFLIFFPKVNYSVIKTNLEINHLGVVKYNHFFPEMACPSEHFSLFPTFPLFLIHDFSFFCSLHSKWKRSTVKHGRILVVWSVTMLLANKHIRWWGLWGSLSSHSNSICSRCLNCTLRSRVVVITNLNNLTHNKYLFIAILKSNIVKGTSMHGYFDLEKYFKPIEYKHS